MPDPKEPIEEAEEAPKPVVVDEPAEEPADVEPMGEPVQQDHA